MCRRAGTLRVLLIVTLAFAGTACARHAAPRAIPAPVSPAVAMLQSDLHRIFNAPLLAHALFGVEVRSLLTGDRLYSLNPSKLVMPASNMKIVTIAAAAERLGWDYRFDTRLLSAAPVEDGVLRGDLIVVGGGDPTIGSRDGRATRVFDDWAAQLRAAGVRVIDGRLIGDDDTFDDEGLGAGWSWDYLGYGYAAPVGSLQYNENVVQLTMMPGTAPGVPATIEVAPPDNGLAVVNRVLTGDKDGRVSLDLHRLPGQADLEVVGTIPASAAPIIRTASTDNPTLYFVRALRAALLVRGIDVRGEAADIDDLGPRLQDAPGLRVLASSVSPTLAEIATVLMKVSQNLYAETLLKTIGRTDGPGTTARGRAVVRAVLEPWGIAPDSYIQYDGSGLSRYNYVTATMIVTILERLYDDPRHREVFAAALPIAGRDGTISNRLKGSRAEANARAKTGSIANVRALSGYVTARDGEPLVFSIIANHFNLPTATVDYAVDLAVETLANFTRR